MVECKVRCRITWVTFLSRLASFRCWTFYSVFKYLAFHRALRTPVATTSYFDARDALE